MMYGNKLAVAIKVGNQVLREFGDKVYVPFGSEYQIYVKNLENKRVSFKIFIDDKDVTDGGLMLWGKTDCTIERSINNGNLSKGNRFKFIERTAAVEQHRGVDVEDGLIRIEYQFEKIIPPPQVVYHSYRPHPWERRLGGDWYGSGNQYLSGDVPIRSFMSNSIAAKGASGSIGGSSSFVNAVGINQCQATTETYTSADIPAQNDVGITVPGSVSSQQFHTTSWFPVEDPMYNIVIHLLGQTADNQRKRVRRPVTTRHKAGCSSCGKHNHWAANFCVSCGTGLNIVA